MSNNSRLTVAVHALCWLELARRRGREPLTSSEIAASLASHPVLVRRTLAPLREAGIVAVAGRGPGAGWRLARPAEQITAGDVIVALDEPATFALHPHEPRQDCPVGFGIRPVLRTLYDQIEGAIETELSRHTVAQLLDAILEDHPLPPPSASPPLH